jgi:hypothetical protein
MDARVTTSRINLVRGDTGPQVQLTLFDAQSGNPFDLTGATVTLHFRAVGSTTLLFSRALTVPVGTATSGIAIIIWASGDLNQAAGDYEGEIEMVFASGVRQTVYDTLQFRIRDQFA